MARQQEFQKEELSSKTLELMPFGEMVTNQDFISRLSGIIDFRWFRTPHIRLMAEFAMYSSSKYGGMLTRDIVESLIQKRNDSQTIDANKIDLNTALYDFNKAKELDLCPMDDATKIAKIQTYVKQEALRNALLDAATDLEQSNTDGIIESTLRKFEDIQKILFESVDLGVEMSNDEVESSLEGHIDYLTNPAARIPTNWNCLDNLTHGGFLRDGKFLAVFMAQAGLGKSNILANLGYNSLKQNLKVVVISMEMSQNVYLRRFDSLISKIDIDQLGFSSIVPQLHERVMNFYTVDYPEAKLNVKEFEPGSKSAKNIESYIEKLVEVKGWKPDVLIIDYLNLIKPNAMNAKGDSSMYQDGKVVSEELRALSYRLEIPIITAVQCNSSGFNTADIGMQNIAESRGIAHTADFIAGLYQTEEEQDNGVFHMKVLKSSLGDKKNLKFEFDKKTMEFRDINDVVGGSSMGGSTTVDSSKSSLGLPQCTEADFDPIKDDIGMP